MEYAAAHSRFVLTSDLRDFPRLVLEWNQAGRISPGVVNLRREGHSFRPNSLVARIERHITAAPGRLQNSLTWLPPLSP